jgi:two-component system, cell cycle sensor histidine kinase and response regulator CckA
LPLAPLWLAAFALHYVAAVAQDRTRATPASDVTLDESGKPSWFEATLPAALLLMGIAVSLRFEAQLSQRTFLIIVPLLALFAILLALREASIERRQAELFRRLEESGRLSRQILAVSPAVHFVSRPAPGRTTKFIPGQVAEELGLDENTGSWTSRVHRDDLDQVLGSLDRAAAGTPATVEYRLHDGNGFRWVHQKTILSKSGDGSDEVVGSIIDISLSKRLELRVGQIQRLEALGKLSGGIAHDFNNLLTTILGFAELALADPELSAAARSNLETIQVAGLKASALTKQLLAFSRQQTLELGALDLNRTVLGMTDMLRRLIGETIEMSVVECVSNVLVESDPTHLEQIVMNLVVNARDAMPSGGRLRIEIDTEAVDREAQPEAGQPAPGLYGVLSVSDSGVGMSDDVQSKIFEPFFTTKRRGQGTGLGLATVHGIVHQHRGFIEVSSREGEGSRFRIFLPSTDKTPVERSDDQGEAPIVAGRESLLVVDDEPSILDLISQALRPAGYEILTAKSGEEALAVARGHSAVIDLLLTDVVLPGISGPDVAVAIKRERPALGVVYMSGYTDDSTLLQQVASGSVPLVRKPLQLGQLTRTLRAVLDAPPADTARAAFKPRSERPRRP